MPQTIKFIAFELTQMGTKSDVPVDPFVRLCLTQRIGETKDGFPFVSSRLASESEIDFHIKCLKEDLDAIAIQAKKDLVRSREKTRNIVTQRVQTNDEASE